MILGDKIFILGGKVRKYSQDPLFFPFHGGQRTGKRLPNPKGLGVGNRGGRGDG
jgi:hypothetical protein